MPRLQYPALPDYTFSTELPVYITHINAANHVDHVQLLGFVAEARTRLLRQLGYHSILLDGCHIVVSDMAVQYLGEAFQGDTVRVRLEPADHNRYGFDLQFVVDCPSRQVTIARGKQGIVFIDPKGRRPTAVPETFLQRLAALRQVHDANAVDA